MRCYPCFEINQTTRPATHIVSNGAWHEHVCSDHAEEVRQGIIHGDTPNAVIDPLPPQEG